MPKVSKTPEFPEFIPYTEDSPGSPRAFVESLNQQFEIRFREIFESCKAGESVDGYTAKKIPVAYALQKIPAKGEKPEAIGARLTYRSIVCESNPTTSKYQDRMRGGVSTAINELRSEVEATKADADKLDKNK